MFSHDYADLHLQNNKYGELSSFYLSLLGIFLVRKSIVDSIIKTFMEPKIL